ncbi:MAG: TIGR03936 family radical SAM-associated protein [Propionibacteriaceae bacterium]|nr:TIGR03936 family radical SAM-associated protein [Propionibacteriaceae bacterium]
MSQRQPPVQQPPPVQRVRLRYAKRGRARFASHRDFSRAFERALRRAKVPMAFSSGFSPHPRISYLNAAPTGAASEAEYVEIALAQRIDPESLMQGLKRALPDGFALLAAHESDGEIQMSASRWQCRVPDADPVKLREAAKALWEQVETVVRREEKNRDVNVRPAILKLDVSADGLIDLISVVDSPLVRPDDVMKALAIWYPELRELPPAVFIRLSQGSFDGTGIVDPF